MMKEWFSRWRPPFALLSLLVLAAGFRLALLHEHSRHPLFSFLRLEEVVYDDWAKSAMSGQYFLDYIPNHAPGYPLVLGLLYRRFGYHLLLPRLLQVSLGLGSTLLAFFISKKLFGQGAALFSALMFSLYWPLLIFEQRLLAEPLYLFLLLCGLFLALQASEKKTLALWSGAGLSVGAAVITRTTAFPWALLLAVWLGWQAVREKSLRTVLSPLVFTGAVLVMVFPVLYKNHEVSGHWLIQSQAGLNIFLGNNPESDGTPYARPGGKWDQVQALPFQEKRLIDPVAQDRFYLGKVREFAFASPLKFSRLLFRKLGILLNHCEVRATVDPEFHRSLFRTLALPLPGFGLLLTFALPGLAGLRLSRRDHQLILAYIIVFGLSVVATVAASRYRLPFAAGLIVLSGGGVASLASELERIRRGKAEEKSQARKRFSAWLALSLLGIFVSRLPVVPNYSVAEELSYLGDAWFEKGDLRRAESFYQQALAQEPEHAAAMLGLARLRAAEGDQATSRLWVDKAVAADPKSSRVHYVRGALLWREGKREEAHGEFIQAVALRPLWVPALYELSRLEVEMGESAAAREHLSLLLSLRPGHEGARDLLSRLAPPSHQPGAEK